MPDLARMPRPSRVRSSWSMATLLRLVLAAMLLVSIQPACGTPIRPGATPATVALAIGIEDDGVTFGVPVGALIQLTLPAGNDWQLNQTDRNFDVIETTGGVSTPRRWLLRMTILGDVQLRAVGAPTCSPQSSACPGVRGFHVTVSVK